MYDDANATAANYPAADVASPRTRERLTAESHWRDICSELTSSDHLAKPFVE